MSSDAVKLAKINRQSAQLEAVTKLMFNPVVELVGGMAIIDQMYPQLDASAEVVTTTSKPNFGNPLWFVTQIFGNKTETTTTEMRNTANDRAKTALMWVILAQQIAPVVPTVISGAGNLLTRGR